MDVRSARGDGLGAGAGAFLPARGDGLGAGEGAVVGGKAFQAHYGLESLVTAGAARPEVDAWFIELFIDRQ